MQLQEHTKCSNPSLSNSTKTTNTMEEYGRKNNEEIHKEEKVIGRNIDIGLLPLFPQRYARIMGGIERRASFPRITMEGRERGKTSSKGWGLLGKKHPKIGPPKSNHYSPKSPRSCPKRLYCSTKRLLKNWVEKTESGSTAAPSGTTS
jgi:hypothetical protein